MQKLFESRNRASLIWFPILSNYIKTRVAKMARFTKYSMDFRNGTLDLGGSNKRVTEIMPIEPLNYAARSA